MTKFKQIIGRGTRIDEEYGKMYFTILDFRNATDLFADPEFDGEPIQIKTIKTTDPFPPIDEPEPPEVFPPKDGENPPVPPIRTLKVTLSHQECQDPRYM